MADQKPITVHQESLAKCIDRLNATQPNLRHDIAVGWLSTFAKKADEQMTLNRDLWASLTLLVERYGPSSGYLGEQFDELYEAEKLLANYPAK